MLYEVITTSKKKSEEWTLATIPTIEQVGHVNLPDDIAPVNAPFETVQFSKPEFPADTVFLQLLPDQVNTGEINDAISALSEKGGGVVAVPQGEWLTGRVELASNVNLYIPEGAVLRFSGWVKDFQPAVFTRVEGRNNFV